MKHFTLGLSLFFISIFGFSQTQLVFYTTLGEFTVEMSDSLTPITSGNFIDLADSGYYDGVIFHRVIDNFMIQGGDPTGTGSGGPGYTIPDEFDSTGTLSNIQKTISMANSGPNTGGSQFFINLVNNTYLDFDKPPFTSKHPVFGMVVEGFEIVQDIGNVAVNASNRPLINVVMDSVRVVREDTTPPPPPPAPEGAEELVNTSLKTKVFPNPVGSASIITVDSKVNDLATISIIDINGRVVSKSTMMLSVGMNRIVAPNIAYNQLPVGVYAVFISAGEFSSRTKFVSTGVN
jgi:cyclophilin family peptidyl-prolyl cis-trans isomerase